MPNPRIDVPSIVIEFVSKGKRNFYRDYREKRDEYLALGVREYWVIDRFQRHMTVVRQQAGGAINLKISEKDVYRTDVLPGFELPLAKLFAIADQ
jgi:Uma2 family endonuclease